MKNWKTTLCGALGALGVYLQSVNDPAWLGIVGQILAGIGTFLLGMFAKDRNVTGGATQQ